MADHLTDLEQLLLLSILRVGEGAYAAPLQEDLAENAEREMTLGSIYNTLLRLEEGGLVRSELGEPTPERGGKSKRFYRVTAEGRVALARAREIYRRMWRGVPPLPEGS